MIQKLRELMNAHPLLPFRVRLADGQAFEVSSPDVIWMPAEGKGGLHFFLPSQDCIVSVNPMMLFSVGWPAPEVES